MAGGIAAHHVANLMGQNGGHLVRPRGGLDKAPEENDEAAREGEGVDHLVVQHEHGHLRLIGLGQARRHPLQRLGAGPGDTDRQGRHAALVERGADMAQVASPRARSPSGGMKPARLSASSGTSRPICRATAATAASAQAISRPAPPGRGPTVEGGQMGQQLSSSR